MTRFDTKAAQVFFLRQNQEQVKRLIAGPGHICDECIDLCQEIIEEEFEDD